MQTSMAVTALFMGLVGGPHCVAMCGAACAGIGRAAGAHSTRALWSFQLSRMVGYALLGAFAAGTVQGLALLGTQTITIRPLWTMFHAAAFLLGVVLIWRARQPAWIETLGQGVWRKARPALTRLGGKAPFILGGAWALMPCGLLYSALLVASLSANAWEGSLIMALFCIGTSVSLTAAPWLFLRLRGAASGSWAIRLAGLALAATSGWALWMGLTNPTGLFCL
jgi:sulfite exporter TauE/SafE